MNYFHPKSAAERYAKGRPDFHSNSIKHIKAQLQLKDKLDHALDVACGTGLSTKALLEIARHVYGTDTSQEMLNQAPQHPDIHYSLAAAEAQPFAGGIFDLITVCSGVHWFDIDRFLAEVHRLLKSNAWLVLYENHFIAEMEGNEQFSSWFPEVYIKKFPSPPRNNGYAWDNNNLHPKKFDLVKEEKFTNPIRFNKKQLALYFTTQSNIIAAVESGQTSYEEVDSWLDNELAAFFETADTIHTIHYGNWIKYLQKLD